MAQQMEKSISESLEMEINLMPFVSELLKDLWALGSIPEYIVKILSALNLESEKIDVLDLGCGKGAVSITLARELGFYVKGVDGCQTFLDTAIQKATEFGVSGLCHFVNEDIFDDIKISKNFDIVIYASLGGILGSFKEIVNALRKTVRPGGYMVIDDGFLKSSQRIERKGYSHYRSYKDTRKMLTCYGDKIINEVLTEQETKDINVDYLEKIKERAEQIIQKNPTIEESVLSYIRGQEKECEILDKYITGAIWLMQRTTQEN